MSMLNECAAWLGAAIIKFNTHFTYKSTANTKDISFYLRNIRDTEMNRVYFLPSWSLQSNRESKMMQITAMQKLGEIQRDGTEEVIWGHKEFSLEKRDFKNTNLWIFFWPTKELASPICILIFCPWLLLKNIIRKNNMYIYINIQLPFEQCGG